MLFLFIYQDDAAAFEIACEADLWWDAIRIVCAFVSSLDFDMNVRQGRITPL